MSTKTLTVEILDEAVVERTAKILGPWSAAQLALNDAKARRESGEKVVLARRDRSILVVPEEALVKR